MVKDIIEKMAEGIGFDIGTSDDVTQAKLLNGFSKGLVNSMDDNKLETQICYLVNNLDAKSRKVMKQIVAFIELDEKEQK